MRVCPVCGNNIMLVSNAGLTDEYGDCTCGFSYKYSNNIRTISLGSYSFTGHTPSPLFYILFTLYYFYFSVMRFLRYE